MKKIGEIHLGPKKTHNQDQTVNIAHKISQTQEPKGEEEKIVDEFARIIEEEEKKKKIKGQNTPGPTFSATYQEPELEPEEEIWDIQARRSPRLVSPAPPVIYQEDSELADKPVQKTQTSSSHIIYKTKAFFPVDFFPDELIIEEERVMHLKRFGPFSRKHFSILVRDISQTRCHISLFFGSLVIQDVFAENEIIITTLPRKKALLAKRIISLLQRREKHRRERRPEGQKTGREILEEAKSQPHSGLLDTGW